MQNVAVTVGTSDSVEEALVLFRGVEESVPTIQELGFDGIEIATVRSTSIDVQSVKKATHRSRLAIPVVSTGQIARVQRVHLVAIEESERETAIAELGRVIEVAAELGADVNISLVRGTVPVSLSQDAARDQLAEALTTLCRRAEPLGVDLLLEQMNRYETNLLNSVQEVGEFIRSLSVPNLKIHADTYHMNIEDGDMSAVLHEYMNELGYIHFSDSNRGAPRDGHIDFGSIVSTLRDGDYKGWIGVETLREPSGEEAARRSIEAIRALFGQSPDAGRAQELRTTREVSRE